MVSFVPGRNGCSSKVSVLSGAVSVLWETGHWFFGESAVLWEIEFDQKLHCAHKDDRAKWELMGGSCKLRRSWWKGADDDDVSWASCLEGTLVSGSLPTPDAFPGTSNITVIICTIIFSISSVILIISTIVGKFEHGFPLTCLVLVTLALRP